MCLELPKNMIGAKFADTSANTSITAITPSQGSTAGGQVRGAFVRKVGAYTHKGMKNELCHFSGA